MLAADRNLRHKHLGGFVYGFHNRGGRHVRGIRVGGTANGEEEGVNHAGQQAGERSLHTRQDRRADFRIAAGQVDLHGGATH